jgi:parallel beta-helix repeat protein
MRKMKPAITIVFIITLAGSLVASLQFVNLAQANFFPDPGPDLPHIYIRNDGSVEPTTAPIERKGSFYKLTDNIFLYTIEIQSDNIVLDGSDYLIRGNESWMGTTPHFNDFGNNGIIIDGQKNVTITHLTVEKCTAGIRISNSSKINIINNLFINETAPLGTPAGIVLKDSSQVLIENNTFSTQGLAIFCKGTNNIIRNNFAVDVGIDLEGSSNEISNNQIGGLSMDKANSNLIFRNSVVGAVYGGGEGIALFVNCTNNVIFENNITGFFAGQAIRTVFSCSNNTFYANYYGNNGFAVVLQDGALNNTFYGNTFAADSCKIQIDDGVEGTLWDNGTIGNYWGDYNGTDNNDDGIGDTPYIVNGYKWDIKAEGFVSYGSGQDNYPLMKYYNIDDNTTPKPSPSISEFPVWITLPITIFTVLITIFLRRPIANKK